ncbi:MAG TPA: hypothetical protein C5S51_10035 [Methanosarcinaceae archaeon]|nr:hypothetical protein [Methanosarcinaceae archaeon]
MKILPVFLLAITTILVSTALAAPILDMYLLEETDCRVCHNDVKVLRNTDHEDSHNGSESCSVCHVENADRKLDCMVSGCHDVNDEGVENHHELEVESCFICHEKGVPRGNL